MAFVQATNDPNAPQQPVTGQPAGNAPQNLPPATSSGAPGTAGAVSGGQGVAATPNAGKQAPVQNLQDYLAANQPQAVAFGNQIAQNLTAGASKVSGDINADQAAIDQSVQASNVTPNPTLVNQAAANPSGFVANPQNLTDFLAQENAKYTGPTSIEATPNWQNLTTEVQNAVQNAPDITKPDAFLQLAAGQETNPTVGMTNLDAALLEETPQAAAPIIAAEKPFAALPGQLSSAASAEDAAIQAAQANDAAASGLIAPAFTTGPNAAVPAFEKGIQSELSTAQKGTTDYNQKVADYIAALNTLQSRISPFVAEVGNVGGPKSLGFSPPSFSPITTAPNAANVATSQDYAIEAALSELLGKGLGTTPIDQSTASQAGTFKLPSNTPLTLEQLASAYEPALAADSLAGMKALPPGASQEAQDYLNMDQNLVQYLNSIDANDYIYNPGAPGGLIWGYR